MEIRYYYNPDFRRSQSIRASCLTVRAGIFQQASGRLLCVFLLFILQSFRSKIVDHFIAIDFETATSQRYSACAVGIVRVEEGEMIEEFYTLIRPPENLYYPFNISIHGIYPEHTRNAPSFPEIYPRLRSLLQGRRIVAHNEAFDRGVLQAVMLYYGLDYQELALEEKWECTVKIYRKKGYPHADLATCCRRNEIELDHHQALSDARACAQLYLIRNQV